MIVVPVWYDFSTAHNHGILTDGWNIPRVCRVRYLYSRYRYGCRTELTEVSGTGVDVVPNVPKYPVPVKLPKHPVPA